MLYNAWYIIHDLWYSIINKIIIIKIIKKIILIIIVVVIIVASISDEYRKYPHYKLNMGICQIGHWHESIWLYSGDKQINVINHVNY